MVIYTNLDTDNMVMEIERHLKGITNNKYIVDTIELHYNYRLITEEEKKYLYNKYVGV